MSGNDARIALASFPRSGNTWMRVVIEDYTGERSGSIYDDRVLPRSRDGVAIKTHNEDRGDYVGAILIVRNPFDAIASFFAWRRDLAGEEVDWDQHVERTTARWASHCDHWTSASYDVCELRFEDLCDDPLVHFRTALRYLGYPVAKNRLASVLDSTSIESLRRRFPAAGDRFFRTGSTGRGVELFDESQISMVLARCGEAMRRFGYETSSEPKYRQASGRTFVFAPHRSGSMLISNVLTDLSEASGRRHYATNGRSESRDLYGDPRVLTEPGIYGPLRVAVEPPEGNLVVCLRDPRDVLVSMFYAYCYSHGGEVEAGTGYRAAVADRGIDEFVLRMATAEDPPYAGAYGTGIPLWGLGGNIRERHERLLDLAERRDALLLSYEDMVRDFRSWLEQLAAALGVKNRSVIRDIASRRACFDPRGRNAHRRYVQPGDHRNRLAPATIERLNRVFAPYWERLSNTR